MRSDTPTAAVRVGLVLAGLAMAGTASAYALIGIDWSYQANPMSEPFLLNDSSFPTSVGTAANVQDALVNGLERWGNEGQANFAFTNGGSSTQTSFTSDSYNVIQWSATNGGGGTLAVAQSWSNFNGMTDCDILVYESNDSGTIAWSSAPAGAAWYQVDLEQTVTHEFGHCAGLAHSSVSGSMMQPYAVNGAGPSDRLLTADDIAGLQSMYGTAVGASMELTMTPYPVVGSQVSFEVTGADPGRTIYFVYSLAGEGSGACLTVLGGECLGVNSPYGIVSNATANSAGEATLTVTLPNSLAGQDLSIQAVDVYNLWNPAILSNPITLPVAAAGSTCPTGESFDCNAVCQDSTWLGDGYCDDGTSAQYGYADFNCAAFGYDDGDCP